MEHKIEQYLVDSIKAMGGICYKFISPGNNGVPDRIVLFKGQICFIELKDHGRHPRLLQVHEMDRIESQGFTCMVIDSKEQVDMLIQKLIGGDLL